MYTPFSTRTEKYADRSGIKGPGCQKCNAKDPERFTLFRVFPDHITFFNFLT